MTPAPCVPRRGWTAALLLLLAALGTAPPGTARAQPLDTVREMRLVAGGATVEIEVESRLEFPVRAEIAVLRIGTEEFTLSRPPADGSLHRLIFLVPAARFRALPDRAPMQVQYGPGEGRDARRVGLLDKAALKGDPR
jgi:hypothetical protein